MGKCGVSAGVLIHGGFLVIPVDVTAVCCGSSVVLLVVLVGVTAFWVFFLVVWLVVVADPKPTLTPPCEQHNVDYHATGNKFERFRGFLELISRFEFEFRRCGNYIF